MSSSSVKIKMEGEDADGNSNENPPSSNRPAIKPKDLNHLTRTNANAAKYPPGCQVWYNISCEPSSKRLVACSQGFVKWVHIHVNGEMGPDGKAAARVFEVVQNNADLSGPPEHNGNSPLPEHCFWEEDLAFAANCPVRVKGVENDPTKEREGRIVFPEQGNAQVDSYSVRFFSDGKYSVEFAVGADRITYRKESRKREEAPNGKPEAKEVSECSETKLGGSIETGTEAKNTIEAEPAQNGDATDTHTSLDHKKDQTNHASSTPTGIINMPYSMPPQSSPKSCTDVPAPPLHQNPPPTSAHDHQVETRCTAKVREATPNEPSAATKTKIEQHSPIAKQYHGSPATAKIANDQPNEPNQSSAPNALRNNGAKSPPTNENNHLNWQPPDLASTASSTKRKLPFDNESTHSHSYEPPNKSPRTTGVITCTLTVPLWVHQKCNGTKDLKVHLLGKKSSGLGHKTRQIQEEARCRHIGLSKDYVLPMTISIESLPFCELTYGEKTKACRNVRLAINLITDSLLEFIRDANSARRLVHELARTASGTYKFRQEGEAVNHPDVDGLAPATDRRFIWTTLLSLHSEHEGTRIHDRRIQDEVTAGTQCWLEAYCSGSKTPKLSAPYLIVCGSQPDEVREVAVRAAHRVHSERGRR